MRPALRHMLQNRAESPACDYLRSIGSRMSPPPTDSLPKGSSGLPQSEHKPLRLIEESEVLKNVHMYKHYSDPSIAPGIEVTNLPNQDDVTQYRVSEEAQGQLWAAEVSRLVKVVTTDTALEFKGSKDLAVDSKKSYEILTLLADQVWQAIHITIYDGESILACHPGDLCLVETLNHSREVLGHLWDKEDADGETTDGVTPRYIREDLFNFIDYCTAVIARILCSVADGQHFYVHVLAHLAKITAKIKVVSVKPQESLRTSIKNSVSNGMIQMPDQVGFREQQARNSTMGQKRGAGGSPNREINMHLSLGGRRAMHDEDPILPDIYSKRDILKRHYSLECACYRRCILHIFDYLVLTLRGKSRLMRISMTSYEMCAMVYDTGFERFRALVFQGGANNIEGTSDALKVNYARSAFNVLNQAIIHVSDPVEAESFQKLNPIAAIDDSANSENTEPGGSEDESVGTQFSWNYAPDEDGSVGLQVPKCIMLKSMSHVITLMIPLINGSPGALNCVSDFIVALSTSTVINADMWKGPVMPREYSKYTASFCLTTAKYNKTQRACRPGDPTSLSNALMRRNNLLSGRHVTDIGRAASIAPNLSGDTQGKSYEDELTLKRIRLHQNELHCVTNKMNAWVLEENGVMVRCKLYVWTLILLCSLLVGGGVSVGVSVGERIVAVDPFNITTYCWVLAAFLLLVAKNIRVQSWAWIDFLHGRVLCKSVSELSSVAGVKEQLILAKLLQDESISFLDTRGPYNTVFRRKSKDGFSIDRPLSVWTMLISGLIMIEVESANGRGLVCLDLRRGTNHELIVSLDEHESIGETDTIYCDRLSDSKDRGDPNRVRLKVGQGITWTRILGLYGNQHAEFI
ncbi:hypothetical protein BGZ61DRAFT_496433 [Ilyonectria robusta]|uniref:uncharacterized protein n=1 Tax=Ilyonectria robusta TaxID=1079257 RepID=UPI001E8CE949|nr:uncharacterized protein BGZ61DRAFT_496433 [Ilyonectria robusta]KAH8679170.1 hypothetical protein BGZ61DRAFT_496433 [Ilyonectria robusta]